MNIGNVKCHCIFLVVTVRKDHSGANCLTLYQPSSNFQGISTSQNIDMFDLIFVNLSMRVLELRGMKSTVRVA